VFERPDSSNVAEIVGRILADRWSTSAAILTLAICLFFVWIVMRMLLDESAHVTKRVFALARYLYREVAGGTDVKSYERLNGVTVIGLLCLAAVCILLLAAHSLRLFFLGGEYSRELIAATLALVAAFVLTGITCYRFCARHHDELRAARKHASGE
jgi:uncharacterized membrane protein (DUF485 family)